MPCSAAAQQRHKIIRNGVALVGEESVSGLTRGSRRGINQENPPMRIYIIGNDGITLCREALATVNDGEVAVASKVELHAAPLSGKRLVWEIEHRLAEDDARPILFYLQNANCSRPQVKGLTTMANSVYNSWRFEDLWLDK